VRVYIVGAHSTGKTTLARWISKEYNLPLVSEVARAVIAEREIPLEVLRVDLARAEAFQAEIFQRQIEAETRAGKSFVSDRAFDNLAYAAQHTLGLCRLAGGMAEYAEGLQGAVVFFVRPHRELLAEDGTRERSNWDEVMRIDGMVKFLLELNDVNYITIGTANMVERARAVKSVVGPLMLD